MYEHDLARDRARAGRREWVGLAVLALPTLLIALDIGVLFLALPHLSADLGATGAQQLWITDIYGFLLAGCLITMGTLGDRIGRRRLLLIGAAAFGAASVLAAYSSTPAMLIAARALLGIAGATLGPSTLALITNMFADARQRGLAISIWAACQFSGAALGPVLGGMLLEQFWWGSVFLLGAPVMLLLLVAGPLLLPEYRSAGAGRIDPASVGLYLVAVLPVIYGIKNLAAGDQPSPLPAGAALAVGILAGALFVRRQRRLPDPMVDLRLFQAPAFRLMLAAMALASGALAGAGLMTSQYVQSVVGLSPAAAGVWQAPTGLGIAAGVLLAPALVTRLSTATTITVGLGLSAAGMLALTQVRGGLVLVVLSVALVAFGVGPLFALGTGLVMSAAPAEKAGSAASLSETSNILGSTLGLALLGTVGTAIYRSQLAEPVTGVPAAAFAAARETIGGAVAGAASLPAGPATALLDAARAAFTSGVNVVSAVGLAMMAGVALAVWMVLRRRAAPQEPATAVDHLPTTSGSSS